MHERDIRRVAPGDRGRETTRLLQLVEIGPRRRAGRVNATVRFTPERYADLKAAAEQSGRSISEEVEVRVERALQYDQMLASMRTTLAEMEQGNVDAVLIRKGYRKVRSPDTDKLGWLEPGHPLAGKLPGRIPPEEDQ